VVVVVVLWGLPQAQVVQVVVEMDQIALQQPQQDQ
jgi:hypothetical protein